MSSGKEREVKRVERDLEHEAGQMEERSRELGEGIDSARQDLERKREDSDTPGLPPREDEENATED